MFTKKVNILIREKFELKIYVDDIYIITNVPKLDSDVDNMSNKPINWTFIIDPQFTDRFNIKQISSKNILLKFVYKGISEVPPKVRQ